MINKKTRVLAIIVLLLGLLAISNGMQAQNVHLQGNTFVVDSVHPKAEPIPTGYTLIDKDGQEYPVYLSKTKKAYIIKVSKKTGKPYRQYLPKVTEMLNKLEDEN